jgi:hypothetical protein
VHLSKGLNVLLQWTERFASSHGKEKKKLRKELVKIEFNVFTWLRKGGPTPANTRLDKAEVANRLAPKHAPTCKARKAPHSIGLGDRHPFHSPMAIIAYLCIAV